MQLTWKQFAVIVGSIVVAFLANWLLWFAIMRHPGDIDAVFHVLTTLCLTGAFLHLGDHFFKAQIFK